jgi:type II secretory ATPase GspE/PulE/Tfp pilus assembly ATPase PilB-like protein
LETSTTTAPTRPGVEDGPIVRLAGVLLDQAIADRASDLHVEPVDPT